jgi:hypothetical protein
MKKAGSREFVEELGEKQNGLMAFLGGILDNPITRSAQRTADPLITAVEGFNRTPEWRQEAGLQRLVRPLAGGNEELNAAQIAAVKSLGGNVEALREYLAELPVGERAGSMLGSLIDKAEREGLTPDQIYEAGRSVRYGDGRYGDSDVGNFVRQSVVPVAAMGAVTGGSALLVKGALDVYARMQAGEPVSEEEAVVASKVLEEAGVK